jgi:hypothetical protein
MTRALFGAYAGPLYNVMKPDKTAQDIHPKSAGGVADGAAHATFCGAPDACTVQKIYDQSPMQNHLGIEHGAPNLGPPRNMLDRGVNFTDPASKASVGGSPVYAARFVGDNSLPSPLSGKHFNGQG